MRRPVIPTWQQQWLGFNMHGRGVRWAGNHDKIFKWNTTEESIGVVGRWNWTWSKADPGQAGIVELFVFLSEI
jgi:hypothetical protein